MTGPTRSRQASLVKRARGLDPVVSRARRSFAVTLVWFVVAWVATLSEVCGELRAESVSGYSVEAACGAAVLW